MAVKSIRSGAAAWNLPSIRFGACSINCCDILSYVMRLADNVGYSLVDPDSRGWPAGLRK